MDSRSLGAVFARYNVEPWLLCGVPLLASPAPPVLASPTSELRLARLGRPKHEVERRGGRAAAPVPADPGEAGEEMLTSEEALTRGAASSTDSEEV